MKVLSPKVLLAMALLALVMAGVYGRAEPEPAAEIRTVGSLSVEVIQAQRQMWPESIAASGALAPWQEVVISAETANLRIASLEAEVGDRVQQGQLLARLAQDGVLAEQSRAQAGVALAQANLQEANSDARRAALVGQSGALSAQQSEQYRIKVAVAQAALASARAELQSARIRLEQTRIVAVEEGVIFSREALLGSVVSSGTELFRLVREGRIEWQAELDARQLARITPGLRARVTLPDGQVVEGKVRLVSPSLNRKTGRALVYVALGPDSGARAGSYASGDLELASRAALTVPDSAVVLRDGRAHVFTLGDDLRVAQVRVDVGRRRDQAVEILGGLDERARVVRSGGAFLNDGSSVTLVQSGAVQP
ncbi:MAG: efflux RND transporter periplasmic adaptor subunit [Pseudomonadota bacterium]